MTEPNKWIDKIQALMRKAEDPGATEEERSSIIDKVTYLMTKYGVEQDMLASKEQRPLTASHRKFGLANPYANKRLIILNEICSAFGCFMVSLFSKGEQKASVFGTDDDIERVYMLYNSLVMQLDLALAQAQSYKPSNEHGKAFNNSFVVGFVRMVAHRIQEAARRAKQDLKREYAGTGMEMVLLDKRTLIVSHMYETYPNLTNNSISSRSTSASGYNAGRAAGQRADIGGARISGEHSGRRAISG